MATLTEALYLQHLSEMRLMLAADARRHPGDFDTCGQLYRLWRFCNSQEERIWRRAEGAARGGGREGVERPGNRREGRTV